MKGGVAGDQVDPRFEVDTRKAPVRGADAIGEGVRLDEAVLDQVKGVIDMDA
jgi:hypothetical protein